ncbi:MAG: molecular chaperone Hsp90 [Clostridiales bacterium]|nr:molecular chaperone Hsp90 [Clostridiales bacterium]
MSNSAVDFVVEKAKALIAAPSCSAEAKAAAQAWLDAVGTERQAEETVKLFVELEEDIMPVEGLIAFMSSEAAAQHFGAEVAAKMAAHGMEIQAAGGKYCDCPACAAVEAILSKKEELLK